MAIMAAEQAIVPAVDAPSIKLARAAWLHEKRGRSDSVKTERAYSSTFDAFREVFRSERPRCQPGPLVGMHR